MVRNASKARSKLENLRRMAYATQCVKSKVKCKVKSKVKSKIKSKTTACGGSTFVQTLDVHDAFDLDSRRRRREAQRPRESSGAGCLSPAVLCGASFRAGPRARASQGSREATVTSGSPSFGYFSWRSKKSDSLPAGE